MSLEGDGQNIEDEEWEPGMHPPTKQELHDQDYSFFKILLVPFAYCAWSLFGWQVALAAPLCLWLVTSITGLCIRQLGGSFDLVTTSRFVWLVVAWLALPITAMYLP